MQIIRSHQRHYADHGWLKSFWLFSFADFYDPDNLGCGVLRVFNDDLIAPGSGFPLHPHREMEIITVVIKGAITHEDSMGHRTVVSAGDVQRMTAGTGVLHSEFNLDEEAVHLYQIWIIPRTRRTAPSYAQRHFEPEQWRNTLLPVASGQDYAGAIPLNANATIYRAWLEAGNTIEIPGSSGRAVFVYLEYGRLAIAGAELLAHDQLRVHPHGPLRATAHADTALILIDSAA